MNETLLNCPFCGHKAKMEQKKEAMKIWNTRETLGMGMNGGVSNG